ncbi:helix-turn-helix domain-containing protein [Halosolutus gelatinilyticus]|uniref:helix-turn-helix domain-containing protein n=1 Tax=Halosolutus gelatinilyticus TaxID=2931975 RepID=UPI001FF3C636|nr:helix-turn-helix domain-containing protein [Halosolutus gelatinilyticus]
MRYVTVVLTPTEEYVCQQIEGEYVDPREIRIDGTLVATQEVIHYVNLLNDGTAVGVAQFSGDADRLAAIESDYPEILSCTVTGGETWLAYMHYEPDELQTTLLELIDAEAISIDWPMRETRDGLRVTFFGSEPALHRMIASIPDEMDLTLERVGEYQREMDDPAENLTDRQQEIVRTAIAMGYYDIPRDATQRDLADELGLSRGTIGEHLRRAEANLIRSVIV